MPNQTSPLVAKRITALDGRSIGNDYVQIIPAAPAERISLRCKEDAVASVSKALGVDLPQQPKKSATKGTRSALWLGPDEWLVIDTGDKSPYADLIGVEALHSSVDVSHRNLGLMITGSGAQAVINAGCPQNLSLKAFPVGACTRTVYGKAEVVIWRLADDQFRMECWRSFAPFVFDLLTEASLDAGV